jgi:hypothetical protein
MLASVLLVLGAGLLIVLVRAPGEDEHKAADRVLECVDEARHLDRRDEPPAATFGESLDINGRILDVLADHPGRRFAPVVHLANDGSTVRSLRRGASCRCAHGPS